MKWFRNALLAVVCVLFGAAHSPFSLAQRPTVIVDWKAELAKAKAGIAKDPKSAYWHNQAGEAYDALGDFQNALREIKLASTLDPSNPFHDYALYALYKRKAMDVERRQVILDALEKDSNNRWVILNLPLSSRGRNIGQTLSRNIGWLSSSSRT